MANLNLYNLITSIRINILKKKKKEEITTNLLNTVLWLHSSLSLYIYWLCAFLFVFLIFDFFLILFFSGRCSLGINSSMLGFRGSPLCKEIRKGRSCHHQNLTTRVDYWDKLCWTIDETYTVHSYKKFSSV